jgi:Fe2+ transport system protein FeoA
VKLSELEKGDRAIIKKIDTDEALKGRLFSFGMARGSKLSVEIYSIAKQTVSVMVDDTLIGLRVSEAKQIEVEKI